MTNPLRWACLGAANQDRKLRQHAPLRAGTSNPVAWLATSAGGVAFNLACGLAKQQQSVWLASPWGDDEVAPWLARQAQAAGLDTRCCVAVSGQASGRYTAVLDAQGDLALALAEMDVFAHLPEAYWQAAEYAIDQAQAVVMDLNLPAHGLRRLRQRALARDLPLALVAVSVPKMAHLIGAPSADANGPTGPDLQGVHLLLLNQDELAALVPTQSLAHAWTQLHARGLQALVVTAGADGLWVADAQGLTHLPTQAHAATDVTGAGDALAATLLHAHWALGQPLAQAAQAGQQAARALLDTTASATLAA